MLHLKHGSAHLDVVTSSAAAIHISGDYVEYADNATYSTPKKIDNVQVSSATTTQILAGTATTTTQGVKEIAVVNTDATLSCDVTVNLHDGAVSCRKIKVTLAPGDSLYYENAKGWYTVVATQYFSTYKLGSDDTVSSTTPTSVTGLKAASLPAGTYEFDYYILYQSAATTTGIKLDVNFTGTVTSFVRNTMYVDNLATASSGAADQDAIASTAQVYGAFASRAKGTAGREITGSVDTANADMLMRIEGLMVVTVAGDLELWHATEVAASNSVIKAGSCLILTKVG